MSKTVPTSFRLPEKTISRLDELAGVFGSRHRVDTLIQAVDLAYAYHIGSKSVKTGVSGDVTIRITGASGVRVINKGKRAARG